MEKKFRRYLLKSPHRTAMWSRIIAKAIDISIVILFWLIMRNIGILMGLFYLSVADALQDGQSFGKKFVGFAVISLEDGSPCNVKQSFIRNLPFLIPLFFLIFPFVGWIAGIVLGLFFLGLEIYLLFKISSGHRLGDVMADTSVIANDGHRLHSVRRSWYEAQKI